MGTFERLVEEQRKSEDKPITDLLNITGPVGLLGPPSTAAEPSIHKPAYWYVHRGTPLQRHCAFFDLDGDGVVHPWETWRGFRLLGFNWLTSLFGVIVIHLSFSYLTQDSWTPDPLFSIHLRNIHRCVHGSDTGTYSNDGTLRMERAQQLLARFDVDRRGGLTLWQGWQMTEQHRDAYDPVGW